MQGGEGWAGFMVIAMVTGLPLANGKIEMERRQNMEEVKFVDIDISKLIADAAISDSKGTLTLSLDAAEKLAHSILYVVAQCRAVSLGLPTAQPTVHYEWLGDDSYQCDWWEGSLCYGARGKTREEALQNALELKAQGLVSGNEWYP